MIYIDYKQVVPVKGKRLHKGVNIRREGSMGAILQSICPDKINDTSFTSIKIIKRQMLRATQQSDKDLLFKYRYIIDSVAQAIKSRLQCGRPGFNFWVRKIPWRRE